MLGNMLGVISQHLTSIVTCILVSLYDLMTLVDLESHFITTVPARYLDLHKINNSSCNYLGSFFIENLNLKKHLINTKTAVLMTDSSKCDGFCC